MNKNKAKATSTSTPAEEAIAADAPVEDEAIEGEVITDPAEQVESEDTLPGETSAVAVIKPAKPAKLTPEEKATNKALGGIANAIRKEVGKTVDSAFATGRLLGEARALLPSDPAFGKWLVAQELGISQPTAHRLRYAAEHEAEVREALTHSARNGRDIGVTTAVKELVAGEQQEGRVSKESQSAVQALVNEEPLIEDDGFAAFVSAAEALDMTKLELGDLVELAGIIQNLAAAYKAEKARR